jgi:hypothetical protein
MTIEKSRWWGRVNNPPKKLSKRSPRKLRKHSLVQPGWNKQHLKKDTTTGKMTQGHPTMVLGMALALWDTTQSTTDGGRPTVSGSGTDHGRSVRDSTGSSTRGSMSSTC